MSDNPDIAPARAKGERHPPWTREEAIEMSKRAKGKPRKRTIMRAFMRRLRVEAEDGEGGTNFDMVARAWVTALRRGDTAALKLALERIDGPVVRRQEVAHTSRLIVSPSADPRALGPRVVELGSGRADQGAAGGELGSGRATDVPGAPGEPGPRSSDDGAAGMVGQATDDATRDGTGAGPGRQGAAPVLGTDPLRGPGGAGPLPNVQAP